MNIFTHISISKILYAQLSNKIDLDKRAFIYGNIKPDLISKGMGTPHSLENYLIKVCNWADDLINNETSIKDYSVEVGVICHYVSDFFCLYHMDEEKLHNFREHFVYELKLHFVLMKNLSKLSMKHSVNNARRNVSLIINDLRKEYFSKPDHMEKDILYALSASICICESVSYFLNQSSEIVLNNEADVYDALPLAGGQ